MSNGYSRNVALNAAKNVENGKCPYDLTFAIMHFTGVVKNTGRK